MAGDENFPFDSGGGGLATEPRRFSAPQSAGSCLVPPHNLQAEESVLGALLLWRDAIGVVGEAGLGPRDFYNPSNQHIFDVIRSIYSTSGPVDVVTVADELRKNGLLDDVGGIERLSELQNATPSVSGAEHYAKIVMDTALLRRLIHTASETTDIAFSEPDDATKAVDMAESRMFEVAEGRKRRHHTPGARRVGRHDGASRSHLRAWRRDDRRADRARRSRFDPARPAAEHAQHRRCPPGDG